MMGQMKALPITERAAIVRTDFSQETEWEKFLAAAQNPPDPFSFAFEVVADRDFEDATPEEILEDLDEDYPHSFIVLCDAETLSSPGFPALVIDLLEERGQSFRAVAEHLASIENNLSIGNMGFAEFAGAADAEGVFRGIF